MPVRAARIKALISGAVNPAPAGAAFGPGQRIVPTVRPAGTTGTCFLMQPGSPPAAKHKPQRALSLRFSRAAMRSGVRSAGLPA